jgi:hypothetical protein
MPILNLRDVYIMCCPFLGSFGALIFKGGERGGNNNGEKMDNYGKRVG